VSEYDTDTLFRIDPTTGHIVATIKVGLNPEGVVATPTAVWVANHHDGTVSRIDPATNAVVASVQVTKAGNSGPQPIASGLGQHLGR
jgi:virginiamycin B lyase